MSSNRCSNCKKVFPEGHPYTMRIEFFPAVEPSLQISEAELDADHMEELEKIVAKLNAMTDDEVIEQEERVYSSFEFYLCVQCRDRLTRAFKDSSPEN